MKSKPFYSTTLAVVIAFLAVGVAFGSSETPILKLAKPSKGDRNWGQTINSNMDKLDVGYGAMVTISDDLPEVYIYADTFNGPTGRTITLPKSVDAVNEYDVKVTATTRGAAIGDIYVTKTTTNFVVKCSETNTTDTFTASVYYIGDVTSYGGSIYRRWYVSPASTITDHANASTVGSLAWVQAQVSSNSAIIEAPGNKTYQIKNNLTLNDNILYRPQMGAVIDTDFSIRDSNYQWDLSGSGTNEYYLQAAGGGNPNINSPGFVIENNARMTDGTVGSLAAGEWDWADNDALGYTTVYVRLSDSTDPDGKAADYVEAGYTLTINGPFECSLHQAFSGSGDVTFNDSSMSRIYPHWWGAVGDGSTDCASAIQAGINAAAGSAAGYYKAVYFPPGIYNIESKIALKTAPLIGEGGQLNTGVRIIWEGAAATTAFEKDSSHEGNNSYVWIENISFRPGTNPPSTWLDFTTNTGPVDVFHRLKELQFGECSDSAIKIGRWINCHWEHLRFDDWGEYAVEVIVPAGGSNLSSFKLVHFTMDHDRAASPAKGMIHLDATNMTAGLGVFEVNNGRVEINTALDATNPAFFIMTLAASPPTSRVIGLGLYNIALQKSAGTCYWFNRNTTNTSGAESLLMVNCRGDSVDGFVAGTPGTYWNEPTNVAYIGLLSLNQGAGAGKTQDATLGQTLFAPYATSQAWRMRNRVDTEDRISLENDGFIALGSGSAVADIEFGRGAADSFSVRTITNNQRTNIGHKTTELTLTAGATVTWASAIPVGSEVVCVTSRITEAISGAGGTTGYQIGDGTDADRWADKTALALDTTTDLADITDTNRHVYTSVTNVVITAKTANFDGVTGKLRLTVHYLELSPPTS